MKKVVIIGGGLAGSEATFQLAIRGIKVTLFEMRPKKFTPAHKTGYLSEIVCSNSFGSTDVTRGRGMIKEELKLLNSLLIKTAYEVRIPSKKSLIIDREKFSERITSILSSMENIEIVREEIKELPNERPVLVATGPLTSDSFSLYLKKFLGEDFLYFYDAIAPIVDGSTLDYSKTFWGGRYSDEKDYLNCPLNEDEYEIFWRELINAEQTDVRDFEKGKFFEACLPIEEIARRGKDTLRFGPLRPTGLIDPKTGKRPFAVVQLRPENKEKTFFSLVGFQTSLKYGEQKRVFRLIPALKNAEFLSYGSMHRNTFINSPRLLKINLELKEKENVFFAGQIIGSEGYTENIATGLVASLNIFNKLQGKESITFPEETMIGALIKYITSKEGEFQPTNAHFGLLPPLEEKLPKKERRKRMFERGIKKLKEFTSSGDFPYHQF